MSYDDDESCFSDCKESKTTVAISKLSKEKQKYSQKFCEKWMKIFQPWLTRCPEDATKPFCRACQCRLDSNRCHLKRHERTTKHARNLEVLINRGEGAAKQNLSIRQERSKYYQQRRKVNNISLNSTSPQDNNNKSHVSYETTDFIEEIDGETYFDFVQADPNINVQYSEEPVMKQEMSSNDGIGPPQTDVNVVYTQGNKSNNNSQKSELKKERIRLLMQIQKDKNDLMQSFKELMGTSIPQSPPREKNHVDLFFESVSSSVKALSPKLAAEAKMRVSQLICELELRALTEVDVCTTNSSTMATASFVMPADENISGSSTFILNAPGSTVISTEQHRQERGEKSQEFEQLS